MEIATFAKLAKAYNGEDESLGNLLDDVMNYPYLRQQVQ